MQEAERGRNPRFFYIYLTKLSIHMATTKKTKTYKLKKGRHPEAEGLPAQQPYRSSREKDKVTHTEMDYLIELIWCDLMNGVAKYQIFRKLEQDAYPVKTSDKHRKTQERYIQMALDQCALELKINRDEMRKEVYSRFLAVYEMAIDQRNTQGAVQALDKITKLMGLYEPDKVEIDANQCVEISFGFGDKGEEDV